MSVDAAPMGILGGTFDPVHNGHLRAALEALEALMLGEIRLIPCRHPPHRNRPVASPSQRLTMLEMAVAGQPGFVVDDRELKRDGPSYMVETLGSLRTQLGPDYPLCLLLGGDAFNGLPQWHRWRQIVRLTHLVVLQRPGHRLAETGVLADLVACHGCAHPQDLRTRAAGSILSHGITQQDISATRIRTLINEGRSPRYLLPESVWAFIREQGLYRSLSLTRCKGN